MCDVAVPIPDPESPMAGGKPAASGEEGGRQNKRSLAVDAVIFILYGLFLIVYIPLYLLYAGAAWLFCNIDVTEKPHTHASQGFFDKLHKVQQETRELRKLPRVIRSRLVIFLLLWLTINLSVRKLRTMDLKGPKLWEWTLVLGSVLCGYHVIGILTEFFIYLLCWFEMGEKNWPVYYIKGLRRNINWLLLSALYLLTWDLYFRKTLEKKWNNHQGHLFHKVFQVITRSLDTFTVGTILWLLKTVLLLKWEADAVYRRFNDRILIAGSQLYFLGYICGWDLGVFKPDSKEAQENNTVDDHHQPHSQHPNEDTGLELSLMITKSAGASCKKIDETKHKTNYSEEEKKKAKKILHPDKTDKDTTLYDIQKRTEYFIDLFKVASREHDSTTDVRNQCKKMNQDNAPQKYISVEDLVNKFKFVQEDAEYLYATLQKEYNTTQTQIIESNKKTTEISCRDFEKFMVKAQHNCVALGHTLLDARAVAVLLNNVMGGFLSIVLLIAGLFFTKLATTTVLLLIASPLLALTFVFGDTCKKIFEGVIFSFVNHPFDVGDRCTISNNEYEVKRMSVLTTTFAIIGTKKEVSYPNSVLATIPIINHKGEPDPSDFAEFTLDSNHTKSMVDEFCEKIKRLFEEDRGMKFEKAHSIIVKDIGDTVKMEIQFDHVMSINEMTHSQCHKKKKKKTKQKSEFLLQIKQMMEEIKSKSKSTIVEIS